jgi:hypothetical protein
MTGAPVAAWQRWPRNSEGSSSGDVMAMAVSAAAVAVAVADIPHVSLYLHCSTSARKVLGRACDKSVDFLFFSFFFFFCGLSRL